MRSLSNLINCCLYNFWSFILYWFYLFPWVWINLNCFFIFVFTFFRNFLRNFWSLFLLILILIDWLWLNSLRNWSYGWSWLGLNWLCLHRLRNRCLLGRLNNRCLLLLSRLSWLSSWDRLSLCWLWCLTCRLLTIRYSSCFWKCLFLILGFLIWISIISGFHRWVRASNRMINNYMLSNMSSIFILFY